MKKEKYSTCEEEQSTIAAEPIVAVMSDTSSFHQDKYVIPVGMPQTVEEALHDIDEGEREFQNGETFTHREVMQMVWDKIGCYAG